MTSQNLQLRTINFVFLYDRKVPLKLKGKFYQTTVRPTMLYGTMCCATNNQHENKARHNRDEDVVLDV
jgi:hypothetical protein